jgi:hypothetical protein
MPAQMVGIFALAGNICFNAYHEREREVLHHDNDSLHE